MTPWLLVASSAIGAWTSLQHVSVVSRHGVRPPYPPSYTLSGSWAPWTAQPPPSAADWGMDAAAFASQELTPHGGFILPLFASWMRAKYDALDPSFLGPLGVDGTCTHVVAVADDSTRDWQTAAAFLDGFGCGNTLPPVLVANATSLPDLRAVLSDDHASADAAEGACARSNLEQTSGLLGECALDPTTGTAPTTAEGNCLTAEFLSSIATIQAALVGDGAPLNASVCAVVSGGPWPAGEACDFAALATEWTGTYYEGMFTSPLFFAQTFAEAFMLEFVGNVSPFAFGALDALQVSALYRMHSEVTMALASNYYNARSYGSAQLAYVAVALAQAADGVEYSGAGLGAARSSTKVSLLFCHDTNLLYLRRLLGITWLASGWQGNAASTGGTLAFELWKGDDGAFSVRVVWAVATPAQQRDATVLSLETPPASSTLVIPACGAAHCALDTFVRVVRDAVDLGCVENALAAAFARVVDAHAPPPAAAADAKTAAAAAKVPGLTVAVVLLALALGLAFAGALVAVLAAAVALRVRRRSSPLLGGGLGGSSASATPPRATLAYSAMDE